ncbi:MAG: hypothetical protein FH753_04505 [Firmicutes bacterium]|nr:hypothetical protein [Bacillota bacterium]
MSDLLKYIKDIGFENVVEIEDVKSFTGKVKVLKDLEDKKYYLKEKDNIELLNREYKLMKYLSSKDIPVAVPLKNKLGDYYFKINEKIYCLYPKLPGNSVDEKHYKKDFLQRGKFLGESVAKLHNALKDYKYLEGYNESQLAKGILECIIPELYKYNDKFDIKLIKTMEKEFEKNFVKAFNLLPKHLIHRDLHPGNILIKDNKLTGFVDFDLVLKSVRIFDPCYCATSILISGIDDKVKRNKWIDIFHSLMNGYSKVGLHQVEIENIMFILYSIELIYMNFSISIDDIGAAKCNEKTLRWLYTNRERILGRLNL